MKMYGRIGGITPHNLNLGTRRKLVVRFMPWPFYPHRKSPPTIIWIEGWMGLRASLVVVAKRKKFLPCTCWELNPCHYTKLPQVQVFVDLL
jgi:hypothetical protein